jgi:hypothetical protein
MPVWRDSRHIALNDILKHKINSGQILDTKCLIQKSLKKSMLISISVLASINGAVKVVNNLSKEIK